jgi:opacity protein-like surface antigen
LGYWNNKFGLEVDWKSYSKKGTPYTQGSFSSTSLKCSINSFLITGYYEYYEKGNFVMYAGAGLGLATFREQVSGSHSGGSISDSAELNGLEIHSTAGFMFRPVYVEIGFSSISFSETDLNPGGILINAGLFF